jgi:hypothetical protein
MPLNLSWDGSDLGDITSRFVDIRSPTPGMLGAELRLKTGGKIITCLAWRYKNDIPLILDELKPLFGLNKIGRHKCTIQKRKVLLARLVHKAENGVSEGEGLNYSLDSIREHIVFRHFFGVITRGEFLWYREGEGVSSYKDVTIRFTTKSSAISTRSLKKWFNNSEEELFLTAKRILIRTNHECQSLTKVVQFLRSKVEAIIRRINKQMVGITTSFMSRVQVYLICLEGMEPN